MPDLSDEIGRLVPHLRRFARALVRGHAAQPADDLVQETVVLAMRNDGLQRGPALMHWCLGTLIQCHRARERAVKVERSAGGHALDVEAGLSAAVSPAMFLPREISRLDGLSLPALEVLLLTVLAGMTYGQIADLLAVTPESVVGLLTEARESLARTEPGTPTGQGWRQQAAATRHRSGAAHLRLVK